MWFMNRIEIPIMNKVMQKGDVHVYSRTDIQRLCDKSGMKLELYEVRKGFHLQSGQMKQKGRMRESMMRKPWRS